MRRNIYSKKALCRLEARHGGWHTLQDDSAGRRLRGGRVSRRRHALPDVSAELSGDVPNGNGWRDWRSP